MDIVHVASELAPVAKVGGLADVIYGLSNALAKKGHRVRIILPKYDSLDEHGITDLHILEDNVGIEENQILIQNTLWSAKLGDLECILVEDHHPKHYFKRGVIYEEPDDNDRFLYFCKVATTYLEKGLPDVVHLHDWPTAGCALMLQGKVKTVFTIHCLDHQGVCASFNFERLNIPFDPNLLRDPVELDAMNLVKGAIHTANVLTTVSPTYAKEILTPEEGEDLDEDLLQHKKQLKGILNGIDINYWNPQTDPFLAKQFSYDQVKESKAENRKKVQMQLGLNQADGKPLVVAITRLVSQKGPDLIAYGIERTIELGGQFVLLGSTTDPDIRDQFDAFDSNPDVAISFEYDEPLSHLLYAASDLFLMPSIFEPCGLTQMIAMRYGSIPLVRSTGGLKDTVIDGENGFTFDIPDNKGVSSVLEKGFEAFQNSEKRLALIEKGMQADWSWDKPADQYLELYK